jgi:2-succinyl-6-hydroxy-2,4-cyclohexadiene-1-carboxylate synthase
MTAPLALLHGFSGDPSYWATVLALLGPQADAVVPALVGHGNPQYDSSVAGFEDEVDRIAALLRVRGTPFHIAGYSLGGRIALGLLVRHPELFASATLISAQPGLKLEEDRRDRRLLDEQLCEILERLGIEAFVAKWENIPLFASQKSLPADLLDGQRRTRLLRDPNDLARSLRLTGLGAMPSYWKSLSSLRVPTTLVVGALDEKFTAMAVQIANCLPNAVVEVIPNVGHNVVLEDPRALTDILRKQLGLP